NTGKVLIAGGITSGGLPLAPAKLYDPVSNTWSGAGTMVAPRQDFGAELLPDGTAVAFGGNNAGTPVAATQSCNPTTNSWADSGGLLSRVHPMAVALLDGEILVAGGTDGGTAVFDTARFDGFGGFPTITNVAPSSVATGHVVTVTGRSLTGAFSVFVNNA